MVLAKHREDNVSAKIGCMSNLTITRWSQDDVNHLCNTSNERLVQNQTRSHDSIFPFTHVICSCKHQHAANQRAN